MTHPDPIASSTLAHLYLAQGHREKANVVLDAVLLRNPADGHALHLRERLQATADCEISLSFAAGELRARWTRAEAPQSVVLAAWTLDEEGLQRFVTSQPVTTPSGVVAFRKPFRRGHACVCLGRAVPGRGFVATCVGEPLVWTDSRA